MTDWLKLEDVEQAIYAHYRWFHEQAPHVVPNPDSGELGALWALFDVYMEEEREREAGRG